MKTTNFQKLKLNRKTSANSGSQKQIATSNKQLESTGEIKADKLSQLKAKVQKERQIMRNTGKRFNKPNQQTNSSNNLPSRGNISIQKPQDKKFLKGEKKSIEVSVGEQQPKQKIQQSRPVTRESINLTELVVQTQQISLNSSKVFQKQLLQQKNRNEEVNNFLKKLGLQNFAEGIINMGYDQLDVLVQITCEELNFLMMRAAQQKILTSALKQYRIQHGLQEESKNISTLTQSAFFKAKVKNQAPKQKYTQKQVTQIRPKSAMTVASTNPTNNSGLFNSSVKPNPSFFVGIGGGDWSLDSLIRRACSSCYKVMPGSDLVEQNGIYSCWTCKMKEDDPLGVSLNNSMIKDYNL